MVTAQQWRSVMQSADENPSVDFAPNLWRMANALRGSMDAAEYKHVVLGLIFLKWISDTAEIAHVADQSRSNRRTDQEHPRQDRVVNPFQLPQSARWDIILDRISEPSLGNIINDAMHNIERHNPALVDVLPKGYNRKSLSHHRLKRLIALVSNIPISNRSKYPTDILGEVYEFFLSEFASAEGKKGGEFYTPRPIVRLLVNMIQPYHGRVYDPCCGSAGMFVQSIDFIRAHLGSGKGDSNVYSGDANFSIYGQEANFTTWRLAKMNLAIRGLRGYIAHGDSLNNDHHPDLQADFILANPPFNISDWNFQDMSVDSRWRYGLPPKGNANFAWVQHMIHHLAPNGVAGFILSNGSLSSQNTSEGEIRRAIIESDLVDCIVTLPDRLFHSTQIPVCLWILAKNKMDGLLRSRRGQTLFIDARSMGFMRDRVHKELSDSEISYISDTYNSWKTNGYTNEAGFSYSAQIEEIRDHRYALVPGRYVGFQQFLEYQSYTSELKTEIDAIEQKLLHADSDIVRALTFIKGLHHG